MTAPAGERQRAVLVEAEGLRDPSRRALAEDVECRVEVVRVERPPDELAESPGGAAGRERGLRERRGERPPGDARPRPARPRAPPSPAGRRRGSARVSLHRAEIERSAYQAGPPSTVPTTTSVEPPPTSQTATLPANGPAAATAPANASRPSSSAESDADGRAARLAQPPDERPRRWRSGGRARSRSPRRRLPARGRSWRSRPRSEPPRRSARGTAARRARRPRRGRGAPAPRGARRASRRRGRRPAGGPCSSPRRRSRPSCERHSRSGIGWYA